MSPTPKRLPKIPVIRGTSIWVNSANRPETRTAQPTRIGPSTRASIGGKGVHMTAPGISAVMKAPRPYADTPVTVAPASPPGPPAAKACECRWCGEPFPSKTLRDRHQFQCARWNQTRVWTDDPHATPAPMPEKLKNPPPAGIASACIKCGALFPSKTARGRHQYACVRNWL
jgi:hypothetical protein